MKKKLDLMITLCSLLLLLITLNVNAIQDNNTANNNMAKYVNVTSTRTMSVLYLPVDQIVNNYDTKVNDNHEFLQATYPIKDSGINKTISNEIYDSNNVNFSTFIYENNRGACGFLIKFNKENRLSRDTDHRVVGITNYNLWFYDRGMSYFIRGYSCYRNVPAIIISAENFRQNTAHEIGHTYGLCDEYDAGEWSTQNTNYAKWYGEGCPNGDEDDNSQLDSDCLDLPEGCPTITDRKVVPYLSGEGDVNLRNFMGGSTYQNNRSISKTSYLHLIQEFTNPAPQIKVSKAVMVSGIIYGNDTVEIDPIYWLENNNLYNGTYGGNFSIIVKENQSDYHKRNFTADFFLYTIGGNSTLLNESGFVFVLPATDDITSIVLEKGGTQLKEINVSPHKPQITVNTINETEPIESPFNLTWNASDADNDTLYYALLVSDDNGLNYTTLEIDYLNTSYEINPNNFDYSEEYLFKVMVTDGVNGNYSYSNTVAMGVMIPNITVTSLQGIYSDNTHKIFQFIILNNGDITLTDINWTINFGDTNTAESIYKFNLTSNEDIFVFVEHNYTDNESHTVTANAYVGNLSASKNITTGGASDLQITSFTELYSMGREKVWEFAIKNNAGTNLTGINWNITGTDAAISSIYSFNLTPNETIRVYVHENLTNYQDYTITAKAFTDSTSGTGTLNTKGKELEVSNIKTLYTNGLTKILEFLVTNTYSSTINNINWSFYTGENTIDSIYTFNLTIIEFRKVDDRTSVLVLKID